MSIAVLLLVLLGCHEPVPLDAALAATGDATRGLARYQMECATCHGETGQGVGSTPGLQHAATSEPDAALLDTILNGRGAMRPVRVDAQAAADIVAHLRATKRGLTPATSR